MELFWQIIVLLVGFVLLIKGADWLVDGATALAKKYKVSDLAIGLTVVAFGTSLPELIVNIIAAIQGHPEIVFGNIIGSNNFNLFVILGISGLLSPMVVKKSTIKYEIPLSLFAAALLFIMANDFIPNTKDPVLSKPEGLILIVCFIGFLYYVYRSSKQGDEFIDTSVEIKVNPVWKVWLMIIVGLVMLAISGRMIVNSAVTIAEALGVSERIIGLTILALGTSLPELATSVIAAFKKNNDIAMGNIVGSNIFNIFFALGVSSLIHPIPYDPAFNIDVILLLSGTAILLIILGFSKKKYLDRKISGLLLLSYIVYMIFVLKAG